MTKEKMKRDGNKVWEKQIWFQDDERDLSTLLKQMDDRDITANYMCRPHTFPVANNFQIRAFKKS